MARMVVIYRTPKNVEAFDRHYFEIHVPLAKKIPGLRKYEVSDGPIATPTGPSNVHRIGTLHFDDLAAIEKAFASSEGQAAGADRRHFAPDELGRSNVPFRKQGRLKSGPVFVSATDAAAAGGRLYGSLRSQIEARSGKVRHAGTHLQRTWARIWVHARRARDESTPTIRPLD